MNAVRLISVTGALCCAVLFAPLAVADDIDIYVGRSGGTGDAPNVMILIDNGPNWSRQSQGWVDPLGNKITQGQAELNAIQKVLTYLSAQGQSLNVGLSMLTPNSGGNGTGGGYIRFGARDMSVAANNTALSNILGNIYQCVGGCGQANESLSGMAHKDETAAFYELYKYFSALTPYSGGPNATNIWDDTNGNLGGGIMGPTGLTGFSQGLTSGWSIINGVYQSPLSTGKPCAASYIIYIANNANQVGSTDNVYEPTVIPALTALPASPVLDTWLDEWTRYLFQTGVVTPAGNTNGTVVTYILDAYNAQNNAGYSDSLIAAAQQGGGAYYQVSSQTQVYNALVRILDQIQAVNSTFASASLPVNATNRAQDQNQVFVPMFRPDATVQPRWFGNLKQYQLINYNGSIQLGDARGQPAVNMLTGFPTSCARSIWTTTSADLVNYPNGYWDYGVSTNAAGMVNTTTENLYAKGTCPTTVHTPWDDSPDGPWVEKGGVAEVLRKGNNPSITNGTPTWLAARNVYTINTQANAWANTTLVPLTTGNTGLPASLVNWLLGQDIQDENGNGKTAAETRPSVHGDEIHSRPLPIDYGNGVIRVFYGSNDGMLRGVDAGSGQELWAFLAPEFYNPKPAVYTPGASPVTTPTGLERLMWSGMTDGSGNQISPIINFPGTPGGVTPTPVNKDYYFDGSMGLYESAINPNTGSPSSVWIYPTMRRGGRMVYAMDVTNPAAPSVLWKFGCPFQEGNDNYCSAGGNASSMGQTWSMPNAAATVLGYSSPVVIFGGGYDTCEDANTPTPVCVAPKGAGVYVLDAHTGVQLAYFATTRSVAADVALISVATAGVVDHAYAADTGGNIYRVDFNVNRGLWAMNRVAFTNGPVHALNAGRKFLFTPALLAAPNNQVYVAIGSGDREHPLQSEYPYASVLNRFYVFKDTLTSPPALLDLDDTTKMYDFTYSASDPGANGQTNGTACGTTGVLPSSAMSGWFMNLNQNGQGEQTVTSAVIAAGMVAFSTNRPIPQSQGSCATVLGAAYGYWVNLFNASGGITPSGTACGGTRDTQFVGGGLPPSPVIAAVPVNGSTTEVVIGAAQLNGGASCGICPQPVNPAIVPERKAIFWKSSGEN